MSEDDQEQGELPEKLFAGMTGEEVSRQIYGDMDAERHAEREAELNHQIHSTHFRPKAVGAAVICGLGIWALIAMGSTWLYKTLTAPEEGLILNPKAEVSAPAEPLERKLVKPSIPVEFNDIAYIIDPGHGGVKGENVGTSIKGFGVDERDYVLDVGNDLANLLNRMGYRETRQTRTAIDPKLKLSDRRTMFDDNKKNIGVALHINGCGDSSVRGVRVYYNNAESKEACGYVADALRPIFGKASVKPNSSWAVMKAKNPVVYVELGFGGSNNDDARILMVHKSRIAGALAGALAAYHAELANSRGLENGR